MLFFVYSFSPATAKDGLFNSANHNKEAWVIEVKMALGEQFDARVEEFDFYKSDTGEICLLSDDGLFFVDFEDDSPGLEKLQWSNPNPVLFIEMFDVPFRKVLFFNQIEMHHGIISNMYSILEMPSGKPSCEKNFYELYGFSHDDEGEGKNGISEGSQVESVIVRNIDKEDPPEIIFKVKKTDYQTGKERAEIVIFKRKENKYVLWKEQKIIPVERKFGGNHYE